MIFLDEVGELREPTQAKLLKVLEEGAVRRLGATESEPVDVWVISATNTDLEAAVRQRSFREDLYHRLAVLTLRLPPLRERGRDIILLATRFLDQACTDYALSPKRLTPDAEARILRYPWPGNIRELGNVMERVALLAEGDTVTASMLELRGPEEQAGAGRAPAPATVSPEDAVRDHLLDALEQTSVGNNSTLRQRAPPSWPPPRDISCHTRTPAAPGADGTAASARCCRSPPTRMTPAGTTKACTS